MELMSTDTLTEHTCGECGIRFAMPAKLYRELQKTGRDFYCPNGHARSFIVGKSEAQKAKEEAQRLRAQLAETQSRLSYYKTESMKYKCPHCSRALKSGQSLIRHLGKVHGIPADKAKLLAAKAGPDALNSNVS